MPVFQKTLFLNKGIFGQPMLVSALNIQLGLKLTVENFGREERFFLENPFVPDCIIIDIYGYMMFKS